MWWTVTKKKQSLGLWCRTAHGAAHNHNHRWCLSDSLQLVRARSTIWASVSSYTSGGIKWSTQCALLNARSRGAGVERFAQVEYWQWPLGRQHSKRSAQVPFERHSSILPATKPHMETQLPNMEKSIFDFQVYSWHFISKMEILVYFLFLGSYNRCTHQPQRGAKGSIYYRQFRVQNNM